MLFLTNGAFVWSLVAAYLVANVLMFATMTFSVRWLAKAAVVNRAILLPVIFIFSLLGAYALSNRMWDVWVVVGFGVIGFGLERAKIPLGPFVIGFVLAPLFESEFRSALQLSHGNLMGLFERPIATAFFAVAVVMLFWPAIATIRRRR
jgi:putative tricarboxylic transport membrane protein